MNTDLKFKDKEFKWYIYSFRSECVSDALTFLSAIISTACKWNAEGGCMAEVHLNHLTRGEYAIEFKSLLNFDIIQSVCRTIVDGHVMLETLRPISLDQNNLSRDHSIS